MFHIVDLREPVREGSDSGKYWNGHYAAGLAQKDHKNPRRLMAKKRTPQEELNWTITRKIIGELLTKHYQACATQQLPPSLQAAIKKLDSEEPEPQT
jgi:hypothetical protein